MGYYTEYDLKVFNSNNQEIYEGELSDHKEEISKLSGYQYCFGEEIKWYEHEDHMIEYSKKHPHLMFQLIGYGEERDDIWCEYFKNGQNEYCKIKIEFPDPSQVVFL